MKYFSPWRLLVVAPMVSAQRTPTSRLRVPPQTGGLTISNASLPGGDSLLFHNAPMNRGLSPHASHHRNFKPLACNADACHVANSTWTSQLFDPQEEMVVIPCGVCVTMDYTSTDTLVLQHGLDVQGTLTFPDGYKLTLETPFVRVQGNLEMKASNPVTDKPNIKIILTNAPAVEFVPEDVNRFACTKDLNSPTPSKCNVGTKAFAVAGGKVDIRGLPPACPTWVPLEDVIHGSIGDAHNFTKLPEIDRMHSNPRCRSLSPYMNEGFASGTNRHLWTGGYGAFFKVTDRGTFLVTGRKLAHDQGPTWDMRHIRDCLFPGQEYLFSARVKLIKDGTANGFPSTCAVSNENCITLESVIKTPSRTIQRRKGYDRQLQAPHYGKWHDFYATVVYDEEELDANNFYQLLRLRGPEVGVDIEMDNVRFTLPPARTLPDPTNVCGGNLVLNGDAEAHPIHPYPISTSGGYLSVERQGKNAYFRHFGRTSNSHSVLYSFDAPGCLVAKAKFRVRAKVRVHSDVSVVTEMQLRSTLEDGSVVKQVIATCPGSTRHAWASCESALTVDPELVTENFRNLRIQFETIDAPEVDMDIDNMHLEALKGPVSSIIVPDDGGLSQCWGKGADLLITSHTLNYDDVQVRRLVSSPTTLGDGTTRLDLESPIIPPTTRRQSTDFATEVALLSRNIIFQGMADDDDDLIGAHFIVFHTSHIQQHLEGVEFRNFGQGNLGRYPIHFHMCGNVRGAIVSKNTVRESNQRCIVVHGTHNLTVSENVAFNTSGHCFITEDGGEIDNAFRGNLGAQTKPVETLVDPSETDDEPSTFWCTNPSNEWEGNVAAGSAENGFWFELRTEVRGPTASMPLSFGMNPSKLPLKNFRDNIAHSNRRHGLRTYPSGYKPNEAAIFSGTKSFKNRNDGIFFHKSRNLVVEGGVLADNRRQADFDRADDIQIVGTSIVGVSEEYNKIAQSQPDTPSQDIVIGLELHGFTDDSASQGATIRGVKFSGFRDDRVTPTALILVDDDLQVGHFDYWSTLGGVQVADDVSSPWFDFGKANAVGISDIFLTDLDSSMAPPGSQVNGSSTILSNSPGMKEFLDAGKCHEVPERSYMYCPNTCLRSILFKISPSETEDFTCRLTDARNASKYISLRGKYYYELLETEGRYTLDEAKNTQHRKSRYFSAALPPGSYVSSFLNKLGNQVWPTYVETTIERPQCEGAMNADAVALNVPLASDASCESLIFNGDFEMSNSSYPYWLHRDSALKLAVGVGMEDSNAIVETIHTSSRGSIGQFLDTRCLKIGHQYEVRAWVKLLQSGQQTSCENDSCPRARVRVRTPRKHGLKFDEKSLDVASTFVIPEGGDGWMLLHGMLTVDARIANASSVWFFVERRTPRTEMMLDNVSVSRMQRSCDDLVLNGNFSNGNSTYWEKSNEMTDLAIYHENGMYALQMLDRWSSSDTPLQQIRKGCFEKGKRYLATAKVKLQNLDGSEYLCDVTTSSGTVACPRMRVMSYVNLGQESETMIGHDGYGVAFTDHGLTPDGWHTVTGIFSGTGADEIGDKTVLSFDRVRKQKNLLLGDVSIIPIDKSCSDLIVNGDGEHGPTPQFWRHWVNRGGANIELVKITEAENSSLRLSNRQYSSDGIHQLVDPRCLENRSQWKISAKMKLEWNSNGTSASCNPSTTHNDRGCPPLRIAGWSSGIRTFDQKLYMTNRPQWRQRGFNTFETHFTVSAALSSCDRVSMGFRSFNIEWDLIVDDIHARRLR